MDATDEKFMTSALKLACKGIGAVEPNPAVGCIIVKSGRVIGRGRHRKFGGPHAEIDALEDCRVLGVDPEGATMYVTLEPCCHEGKTGPCADAVIGAKVAKVVVAMADPAAHVDGGGIAKLRAAGIEVEVGCCEREARLLNGPFVKWHTTGESWVVLKWAQSIDGKLARTGEGAQQWISNEASRKDVHRLRRRVQAILVGVNTVLADDPLLTARPSKGRKPLRIVLDSHLRTPVDCRIMATVGDGPVLIYACQQAVDENGELVRQMSAKGAEVLAYPDAGGESNLHYLLAQLRGREIMQLLVEGGATVLTSFLREGVADEICVYVAPMILGGGGCAEITGPMSQLGEAVGLHNVEICNFGEDVRIGGLTDGAMKCICPEG